MGEQDQDEAYRRLRAADPAAHIAPDLDRLLADARARAGLEPAAPADPGDADPGLADPGDVDPGDADPGVGDLAARRRRRARVWQIAAGVVTVVAVGASGYGLGARGSSSATSQIGAPEAAGLAGSALKDAAGAIEPGTLGPGTVDRGAFDATGRAAGPRTFVADGVGQDAGTGVAYSLGSSTASAAWAGRVARAWHVDGAVVEQTAGSWTVSGTSGAWVTVTSDGDVSRVDYATSAPDGCAGAGADVDCSMQDGARSGALATLAAAGVDVGALAVEVTGDAGAFTVTAMQRVDGAATPLGWTVQVATGGVTSISGTLGDVASLGTYSLVSPAQAALRLNEARFSGWPATMAPASAGGSATDAGSVSGSDAGGGSASDGGSATTGGAGAAAGSPNGAGSAGAGPAGAATPGAPVPWPVTTVRIVQARLGLALTPGEHQMLVPAYELTDDSGATYVVPALTDDALEVVDR